MYPKPIPQRLLPDVITVQAPIDGDWGGEYGKPATIENVRFDSSTGTIRNVYQFEDESQGLIYVDAVTSTGAFEIPVGSKITLNGEKLSVVKNNRYETFNGRVHHWEVEVK